MPSPLDQTALLDQINKRLTLNLLIQGSAQHTFLTAHHLVRDELNAIHPDLITLYDKFAVGAFISCWYGANAFLFGSPAKFWKRVESPLQPFRKHPFLVRHGAALAEAARQRAVERTREKRVWRFPLIFSFQFVRTIKRIMAREAAHKSALEALAKRTTNEVWGIPPDRMHAELTRDVAFGVLSEPTTTHAKLVRASAVGYGGVLRGTGGFDVVAKAWFWSVLSHELVKGTAELICLHGLNELPRDLYTQVLQAADRVENEFWMLPTGAELWRRLLQAMPANRPLSEVLMHIARLPPAALEHLMTAILENPPWATELLTNIGAATPHQGD